MSDVTPILDALGRSEPQAAGELLPLVYDELRRLAARRLAGEAPGQTLDATALVHEAYLRLVGGDPGRPWQGRAHFFAAAAESMRRILVENARRKRRLKHGGGLARAGVEPDEIAAPEDGPSTSCSPSTRPSTASPRPTPPPPSWSSSAISPGSRSPSPPRSSASRPAPPTASGPMPAPGSAARSSRADVGQAREPPADRRSRSRLESRFLGVSSPRTSH